MCATLEPKSKREERGNVDAKKTKNQSAGKERARDHASAKGGKMYGFLS